MRRTKGGARRWLSWSTLAVLAGVAAALVLRTNVALLSTEGSSMAPRFHSGDLAITVATDDYEVGDIAAYKSPDGPIVLHRIVASSDGHYTFKGDNNSWTDPTRPASSQLVGKLWVHVPQLGALVNLRSNVWRVVVLAVAALLIFGGRRAHSRRRRRREEEEASKGQRPKPPTRISELNDAPAALVVPVAVVLAATVLVGIAFHRAPERESTTTQKYKQEVRFGYTGTAPTGTTYPDGTVSTGAPIFLKLVSSLRFQIGYELSAKKGEVHNAGGNYSIDAIVSGIDSWSKVLPLQPRTNFEGEAFSTEVTIDIPQIRQIVRAAQAETGVGSDEVKVSLRASVATNGFVDEIPVSATFDKPLDMTIGTDTVKLSAGSRAADGTITASETAPYKTTVAKPNRFELFGRRLDVSRARALSGSALVLALLWLAVVAVIQDRLRHRPEAVRIAHRYKASIIEITTLAPMPSAVDVASVVALVRIAQQEERFILHHSDRDQDTFLVEDDGTTYRYAVDRWPERPRARVVERADLPPPVITAEPAVPDVPRSEPQPIAVPAAEAPDAEAPVVEAPVPVEEPPTDPVLPQPNDLLIEPGAVAGLIVASMWPSVDDATPPPYVPDVAPAHDAGTPPPFSANGTATPPPFVGAAPTLDQAIRLTPLTAAERAELDIDPSTKSW